MNEISFTIANVERETGLSKDLLRMWERRYGFPAPERDANGDRVYPAEQVERLRRIKRLIDRGHRPGKLIAAHILVDWENALVVKGKPVAYDPAIALQILSSVDNRKIGDAFRNAVANASAEVADRHLGVVKAIVGN